MNGTIFTKLFRLTSYLLRHPTMVSKYFRESIGGRSPLELELPWLSYSSIQRLETFLKPNHEVVEFGGGGSTLFFARRVASVLCIESNQQWADTIKNKLDHLNFNNVSIELLPYSLCDVEKYKSSLNLKRIEGQFFDVILVDGYEKNIKLRPSCFWQAEKSIKKGGIIIVDDAWRYPLLHEKNKANRWEEHCSIGPCRPGITSTDIYYY